MGSTAMSERTKIDSYLQNARDSFDGKPWYGTSTMRILEQVAESQINVVPEGFQKSIATLLRHMLAWKIFVIAKLKGQADYRIPDDSSTNWDYEPIESGEAWDRLIAEIRQRHTEFIRQVEALSDADLYHQVEGSIYSKEYLIRGAIQHDIFHLGQIALMMRAVDATTSSNS